MRRRDHAKRLIPGVASSDVKRSRSFSPARTFDSSAAATGSCGAGLPVWASGTGHTSEMTEYVAWTSADLHELDPSKGPTGPWRDVLVTPPAGWHS